jgi:hypothetical protein
MASSRFHFGLATLADGTALAAGGVATDYGLSLNTAELYQPSTGKWSTVASMKAARFGCGVAALSGGSVLVVGGVLDTGGGNQTLLASAEQYHPGSDAWRTLPNARTARYFTSATAVRLQGGGGGVLLVGGLTNLASPGEITATVELYTASTGKWSAVTSMQNPRHSFGAVLGFHHGFCRV